MILFVDNEGRVGTRTVVGGGVNSLDDIGQGKLRLDIGEVFL